jgi:Tfp pilus assembly protein PilV
MLSTIRRRLLRDEAGQSLIEVMIALIFIAIAVAAVLALMTSNAISLRRASQRGTALTLADKQLETYRVFAYKYIRLNAAAVSGLAASSPYKMANAGDSTIPAASTLCTTANQVSPSCLLGDTTPGEQLCSVTGPACTAPVQTVTGPDHRSYEIDTYMTFQQPSSSTVGGTQVGRALKYVLVVVRDAGITSKPILARNGSTFDQSTAATG